MRLILMNLNKFNKSQYENMKTKRIEKKTLKCTTNWTKFI